MGRGLIPTSLTPPAAEAPPNLRGTPPLGFNSASLGRPQEPHLQAGQYDLGPQGQNLAVVDGRSRENA